MIQRPTEPNWTRRSGGQWGVRILVRSTDEWYEQCIDDPWHEPEPTYARGHQVMVVRRDGDRRRVSLGILDHTSLEYAPLGHHWEVYRVIPNWVSIAGVDV